MARIGLSKPYAALYTSNSAAGTVSLGTWTMLGHATSVTLEAGGTESNALYADNAVQESVSGFSSGSGTLGMDELRKDARKFIYGLTEQADGRIVQTVNDQPPYLALAFIVKHQTDNAREWECFVLHKVKFGGDALDITTEGEDVEFQTPELDFDFMRDDTETSAYCSVNTFETEAAAFAWMQSITGFPYTGS